MESENKRKVDSQASSSAKRWRGDEEDSSSFEKELATLASAKTGQASRAARRRRPPLPTIDPNSDKIVFQQLDLEHYIGK